MKYYSNQGEACSALVREKFIMDDIIYNHNIPVDTTPFLVYVGVFLDKNFYEVKKLNKIKKTMCYLPVKSSRDDNSSVLSKNKLMSLSLATPPLKGKGVAENPFKTKKSRNKELNTLDVISSLEQGPSSAEGERVKRDPLLGTLRAARELNLNNNKIETGVSKTSFLPDVLEFKAPGFELRNLNKRFKGFDTLVFPIKIEDLELKKEEARKKYESEQAERAKIIKLQVRLFKQYVFNNILPSTHALKKIEDKTQPRYASYALAALKKNHLIPSPFLSHFMEERGLISSQDLLNLDEISRLREQERFLPSKSLEISRSASIKDNPYKAGFRNKNKLLSLMPLFRVNYLEGNQSAAPPKSWSVNTPTSWSSSTPGTGCPIVKDKEIKTSPGLASLKQRGLASSDYINFLYKKHNHNKLNLRHLLYKYHLTSMTTIAPGNYHSVAFNFIKLSERTNTLDSFDYTSSRIKKNISMFIKFFFFSIGNILISKPFFIFEHNKITIQLSFFLNKNLFYSYKMKKKLRDNISVRSALKDKTKFMSVSPIALHAVSSKNGISMSGFKESPADHLLNCESDTKFNSEKSITDPLLDLINKKASEPSNNSLLPFTPYKKAGGYLKSLSFFRKNVGWLLYYHFKSRVLKYYLKRRYLDIPELKNLFRSFKLINKKRKIKKIFSPTLYSHTDIINNWKFVLAPVYKLKPSLTFLPLKTARGRVANKKVYINYPLRFNRRKKIKSRKLSEFHNLLNRPNKYNLKKYSAGLLKKRRVLALTQVLEGAQARLKGLKKKNKTSLPAASGTKINDKQRLSFYKELMAQFTSLTKTNDNISPPTSITLNGREGFSFSQLQGEGAGATLWFNKNKRLIFYLKSKLNALTYVLEKFFNCKIHLELTRLKYPYSDSNMMAQLIGLLGKRRKFETILDVIFSNSLIFNPNECDTIVNFIPKKKNSLVSSLSGIKIRMAGRYYRRKIIPRKTVFNLQKGSLARGVINFVESAKYINKTKRGSFCVTISVSHAF